MGPAVSSVPVGYELRPIPPDDLVEAARAEAAGFGEHLDDQFLGLIRANIEYDRSLAVYEAGRPVATAGAYSYELTLPGLTTAPVAAVTAVAVLPTHRRRGLLTRMMAHQLDDVRARGEALAVLTASESIIYGRFGYGPATYAFELEIDAHRGAFGRPVEAPGRLRLLGLPMLLYQRSGLQRLVRATGRSVNLC